jgi:hypothetical protein
MLQTHASRTMRKKQEIWASAALGVRRRDRAEAAIAATRAFQGELPLHSWRNASNHPELVGP